MAFLLILNFTHIELTIPDTVTIPTGVCQIKKSTLGSSKPDLIKSCKCETRYIQIELFIY